MIRQRIYFDFKQFYILAIWNIQITNEWHELNWIGLEPKSEIENLKTVEGQYAQGIPNQNKCLRNVQTNILN